MDGAARPIGAQVGAGASTRAGVRTEEVALAVFFEHCPQRGGGGLICGQLRVPRDTLRLEGASRPLSTVSTEVWGGLCVPSWLVII